MQHFIQTKLKGNWVIVIMGLFFILYPIFADRYTQHIFVMIIFFALAAQAWNLMCGYVGELSLGHGIFLGIGGYTSSLLLIGTGLNPWIGMIIGAVLAMAIGIAIGYPSFKLRGPYFTLTSIAFAEILRIWVENNETLFGIDIKGAQGITLPQLGDGLLYFEFYSKLSYYYIALIFLAGTMLVTYFIRINRFGFYLTAIKSDPDAAQSLGINLTKYKLLAMAISSFIIAFAGTFYAQYFRYIGPTRIFGHDFSVEIALIGLVGGQGTILGPWFGAMILVPVSEYLSEQFGGSLPGLHLFIYGVIMTVVVFKSPEGVSKYIHAFSRWIEKKIGMLFGGLGTNHVRGGKAS